MTSLSEKKIALLVTDGFEQVEMVKPREALIAQGAKTYLISNKSKVQGWNHEDKADIFDTDILLKDVNPSMFDALVLPGGVMNPDSLRLDDNAIDFIKKINEMNKPIAAICHGPWLLINAEIVKGRHLTSWKSVKVDLVNAGGLWEDKSVVIDDNLITSRNPNDIPDFNSALIESLARD